MGSSSSKSGSDSHRWQPSAGADGSACMRPSASLLWVFYSACSVHVQHLTAGVDIVDKHHAYEGNVLLSQIAKHLTSLSISRRRHPGAKDIKVGL